MPTSLMITTEVLAVNNKNAIIVPIYPAELCYAPTLKTKQNSRVISASLAEIGHDQALLRIASFHMNLFRCSIQQPKRQMPSFPATT